MTVSSTPSEISYACNGVTLAYPIPFPFQTAADLLVTLTDAAGNPSQILTGFVISGGAGSNGTITFGIAPQNGRSLTVADNPELSQTTDYADNDAFPAETHERALDKGVRISKRLFQLVRRSLHTADGDPVTDLTLGSVDNRKGKYLFFNAVTGAIEYAIGIAVQALSRSIIGQLLNPQTDAEQSVGVVPINYFYAEGDLRRYVSAWTDGSVQTTGLNNAIRVALASKGRLTLPSGLYIKTGPQSFTMPGNLFTQGLSIVGPGFSGAVIEPIDTSTTVFTFSGANPTGDPSDAPLLLQGFTIAGITGNVGAGVKLNGIANWTLRDMIIHSFSTNLHLFSALIGTIDNCGFHYAAGYGIAAQKNGGGSGCNHVNVRNSKFTLNQVQAIYLASGDHWVLDGNQIEGNGTPGVYTTGGLRIVSSIDDDIGSCNVAIRSNRFEGNAGYAMLVDAVPFLTIDMSSCEMLSGDADKKVIKCGGIDKFLLSGLRTGALDDVDFGPTTTVIFEGSGVHAIFDANVTYPYYRGVSTNVTQHIHARMDSYTGTLTGCTSAPTANVIAEQEGDHIALQFDANVATSNLTSGGIDGLPLRYRPSADRGATLAIYDNGAADVRYVTVKTTGLVDFGAVTNTGPKGVRGGARLTFVK